MEVFSTRVDNLSGQRGLCKINTHCEEPDQTARDKREEVNIYTHAGGEGSHETQFQRARQARLITQEGGQDRNWRRTGGD